MTIIMMMVVLMVDCGDGVDMSSGDGGHGIYGNHGGI